MNDFCRRFSDKLVGIFIFIYILFFSFISFAKYRSFSYGDFDLAIYNQILWNLLHGKVYVSIHQISLWAHHFNLIFFLIIPLYLIYPSPLTLLFLQSFCLGLGALPLYLLARHELDRKFALVFAFSYLFYPALGYVNLFEFHPIAISTPLLLFTFYYFKSKDFNKFLIFLVLSLFCKENISLIIFMFGLYALLNRRSKRWILIPCIVGAFWFYLSVGIIMPHFSKIEGTMFGLVYQHLGNSIPQILKTLVIRPIFIFKLIFNAQNMIYLVHLFGPLCFLSFLNPSALLLAFPIIMQHLLSLRFTEHTIYYHYTAAIIPFIFISAIYGTKFLLGFKPVRDRRWMILVFLIGISLFSNVYLGPHFYLPIQLRDYQMDNLDGERLHMLELIPKDASVIATFEFLPRLSNRNNLYSFHHLYIGKRSLSNIRYTLPQNVEYVLVDFNDQLTFENFYSVEGDERIRKFLKDGNWEILRVIDTIVLFKKNYRSNYQLYEIIEKSEIQDDLNISLNNKIAFLKYEIEKKEIKRREALHLICYWKCLDNMTENYWIFFQFIDKEGRILHQRVQPLCYRVYPTSKWTKGQLIKTEYWLLIPRNIPVGNYNIEIGAFGRNSGRSIETTVSDVKIN